MSAAGPRPRTFVLTYLALLALLVLTAGAASLPLGRWSVVVALAIAGAKMALIFLFFMHLKYERGLVRIFAFAGFFWLAIIAVLTFADVLARA